MSEEQIIPPQPGGSLMLAWQVKGKHVLVVGAGDVALSRVDHLLVANAKITVISGPTVHPTLEKYHELGLLQNLIRRNFKLNDLKMYERKGVRSKITAMLREDEEDDDDDGHSNEKCDNEKNEGNQEGDIKPFSEEQVQLLEEFEKTKFNMVLTCLNDHPLSLRIWQQCKKLGIDVNLADKPAYCDFYFGSVYRQGPLQIMISTNGKSPRLCNRIKNKMLVPLFDDLDLDRAVENLGYLRMKLRSEVHPGEDVAIIKERMDWNKKITDFYAIREWCRFDKEVINKILKVYPKLPSADTLN